MFWVRVSRQSSSLGLRGQGIPAHWNPSGRKLGATTARSGLVLVRILPATPAWAAVGWWLPIRAIVSTNSPPYHSHLHLGPRALQTSPPAVISTPKVHLLWLSYGLSLHVPVLLILPLHPTSFPLLITPVNQPPSLLDRCLILDSFTPPRPLASLPSTHSNGFVLEWPLVNMQSQLHSFL